MTNITETTGAAQGRERVLATIPRRDTEEIRVTLAEWRGAWYVSARLYFKTPTGTWAPTRKGVTIPCEQLPELLDGLGRARVELEGLGELDRAA